MNRFTSFMTLTTSCLALTPTAIFLSISRHPLPVLSLSLSLSQNSISYLPVMERSSAVLCQARENILNCRGGGEKEINKKSDLSVLVSLHWISMIWSCVLVYLLICIFFLLLTESNAVHIDTQHPGACLWTRGERGGGWGWGGGLGGILYMLSRKRGLWGYVT